eukprot:1828172-Pyramimonas_sp.AAC.1
MPCTDCDSPPYLSASALREKKDGTTTEIPSSSADRTVGQTVSFSRLETSVGSITANIPQEHLRNRPYHPFPSSMQQRPTPDHPATDARFTLRLRGRLLKGLGILMLDLRKKCTRPCEGRRGL